MLIHNTENIDMCLQVENIKPVFHVFHVEINYLIRIYYFGLMRERGGEGKIKACFVLEE